MNVMWYVGKFDEATWAFFANIGLSPSVLRETKRGMAALDQQISYKREAHAGDTLEIYTRPIEIKAKTIRFAHTMIDCESGEVASTTELLAAHLDTNARKAVEFPQDVRQKVRSLIGE
jgi:acyl-CoA thioester hydrolase